MEGKYCSNCGCKTSMHHYLDHLCYNCYEDMFRAPVAPRPVLDEDPDADFVVRSETATINLNVSDGQLVYTSNGYNTLKMPKRVIFNPDCRVKDYEKLVLFLLENLPVYDNAKGFDKVSYMFKEVDK